MERVKCKTCGVEVSKDLPMAQTVEQWRYLYTLAENAMFKDKDEISRLKTKINKLSQKEGRKRIDENPNAQF